MRQMELNRQLIVTWALEKGIARSSYEREMLLKRDALKERCSKREMLLKRDSLTERCSERVMLRERFSYREML